MKKVLCVALLSTLMLTSCGEKSVSEGPSIDEELTVEQLIEKAKAETGEFNAYGNTSRITAAVEGFIAKYPELSLKGVGTKLKDTEIYELIGTEKTANDKSKSASLVLIQDSASLLTYRQNTDLLTNYVPKEMKGKMDENDLVPLAQQFTNKLFIWNNTAGAEAPAITNVWELTEEKFKNKIYFKSPTSEQVNMNFLATLTSDKWVKDLTTSYKNYFNKDYVAEEKYKSISYKWISEFLANADINSYDSDTKMAAGVSNTDNKDKIGLFVLSKLRDKTVTTNNLQVGAWTEKSIEPFAGFMYAIYSQVVTAGPRKYTAMLFTHYLMSDEGFKPWSGSVGGYSANPDIPQFEGDKPLSFYKNNLVVEDPKHINTIKIEFEDYINKLIAK